MANLEDRLTLAAFNSLGNEPGTCKLVWGTYTGDGTYGAEHPTTIDLPGRPLYFLLRRLDARNDSKVFEAVHGEASVTANNAYHTSSLTVAWEAHSISWYNASETVAAYQCNGNGEPYYYIALVGM